MASPPKSHISPFKVFLSASAASMVAEACTLPIDITKIRLQLEGEQPGKKQYRGMFHAGITIVREEGARSLYKGASAALLRQCVYSGMRFWMYDEMRKSFASEDGQLALWKKVLRYLLMTSRSLRGSHPVRFPQLSQPQQI